MVPGPSHWHLHKCWSLCCSQQHIWSRRTAVSGCLDFCEGNQRVAILTTVYSWNLIFYILAWGSSELTQAIDQVFLESLPHSTDYGRD